MSKVATPVQTINVPRRIVILGYAPSVRFTPWNDPTLEVWGLNDQPFTMPRVDVLFELHPPEVIKAEGHWEKLKELKIPIFMQDHYDEIPNSIKYPLEAIALQYVVKGTEKPYLTCSASEMLAVAISSVPTPTEILIYGIDMAQDHEYAKQRPSCEFWLGVAVGRGIKIQVQEVSDLLQCRFVYGFEEEKLKAHRQQMDERRRWLQDRLNEVTAREVAAKEERLQYVGALADSDHVIQRWGW